MTASVYPNSSMFSRPRLRCVFRSATVRSCEEIGAWQAKACPTSASCLCPTVGHASACQRPLAGAFFLRSSLPHECKRPVVEVESVVVSGLCHGVRMLPHRPHPVHLNLIVPVIQPKDK